MSDDKAKEGEVIPKDELPPWVGNIIEKWIDADVEKLRLNIAADEKLSKRETRFAWVLLIFTLGAMGGLYVTGNRADAVAIATHALAFFFGIGIAAIRGSNSSAE